jgi:dihydropteroate synthase
MTDQHNVRVLAASSLSDVQREFANVAGVEARALAPSGLFYLIRADRLSYRAAMWLKQILLSLDANCVTRSDLALGDLDTETDVVIYGSLRQYRELLGQLDGSPLAQLRGLAAQIEAVLDAHTASQRGTLTIRNREFLWGERTYVMGILNVTPDSFSGDGLEVDGEDMVARALVQARQFAAASVDIFDVGGESTRPGSQVVDVDEERRRVLPVIKALRNEFDLPISVDTWKTEVAADALAAGADIVNTVWGLRLPHGGWDQAMAQLVRQQNIPIILMHNRQAQASQEAVGGYYKAVEYVDLLGDVIRELRQSVQFALEQGIPTQHIILDPGIGFGKTPAQNIHLLQRLSEFRSLGYPLLLGTSRKSFIGLALGGVAPQERVEGTAATVVLGIQAGIDIVRVHDVAPIVRIARMTDAVVRPGAWERLTAPINVG